MREGPSPAPLCTTWFRLRSGRGDLQELDCLRVAENAAHPLAYVELHEARGGDLVTGHPHTHAIGDQIALLEVAERQRERSGSNRRHVLSLSHAIPHERSRLALLHR